MHFVLQPRSIKENLKLQSQYVGKWQHNFEHPLLCPISRGRIRVQFMLWSCPVFSLWGPSLSNWAIAGNFFLSPHSACSPRPYSSHSIQTPQLLASSWAFLACALSSISQAFMDSSLPPLSTPVSINVSSCLHESRKAEPGSKWSPLRLKAAPLFVLSEQVGKDLLHKDARKMVNAEISFITTPRKTWDRQVLLGAWIGRVFSALASLWLSLAWQIAHYSVCCSNGREVTKALTSPSFPHFPHQEEYCSQRKGGCSSYLEGKGSLTDRRVAHGACYSKVQPRITSPPPWFLHSVLL